MVQEQLALEAGESTVDSPAEPETKPETLADLNLKTMAVNSLINRLVRTVDPPVPESLTLDSLCERTPAELLKIKHFGRKSLKMLREQLAERGRSLKDDVKTKPAYGKVKGSTFIPSPTVRGSSLQLGKTCPGSVFLAQKIAQEGLERRDNKYASVGTMAHTFMELMITKSRMTAVKHLEDAGASDDLKLEVADFWDFMVDSELLPAMTTAEGQDRGVQVLVERPLSYKVGEVTITGHLDLVELIEDAAIVVDWKFYNRPDMLPPVDQDLQMIAYGVGAWKEHGVRHVTVHRILGYQHWVHTLELDAETLPLAEEVVKEEANRIWQRRRELIPGAQCRSCFQANHCPAMREHFKTVDTSEIKQYSGGDLMTRDDVRAFLMAVPMVEARIKEGMAACKRFVEQLGEPIFDDTSGMEWGPKVTSKDTIVDPSGCLAELMQLEGVDQQLALEAATTSKAAMERSMKTAKVKPAERREFIDFCRERGLILKQEGASRWEWRKRKEDK